ncbi:hypothetical protein GFS31_42500 (plasmid) [Leptolyngbya sp. BL0902]|uniref:hypothetical protein n=1 Tax=Leptolyngbya sp. BL0902 TaxID=1115757 RepID=UPI0018E7D338|nr:hypothetical protein [Leptolyngbya sp. BL0902]QQE67537.1 hypothetical protein GFS31_42500 [Leptolyngbya sp. BL0902]
MPPTLNEALSLAMAKQIKGKAGAPFDNAHRAVITLTGATYVQGFVVVNNGQDEPIEHAWIELGNDIIDPTLPHINKTQQDIDYFPAQSLSIKALKASIEEAQEDYPDDPPLPIYGAPPYEYYGDVMLGGKDYANAYQAAVLKSKALKAARAE